ncbi:AraC family transcriptional regulator [Achromobacter sp. GG226]|uniref:anthranilate 1,2-dioxygenase regulatory protein AndR n=1 Tax=Verticiella alkaliphila TaxID=2779529 RepID=UPI001C0C28F1|nr:anthranilate 1,2-dioxygenase regulatory protein AndR [Verticiella sp. GG226]MBU4609427.1 AraC family transcriptional regulator [Verticiella sp. GG226]
MLHALPAPAELLALRQHRYFESTDVDDTRIRISTVLQPHRLEPTRAARRASAHMDVIKLGGVTIGALDFGDEMDVTVDQMAEYYLFVLCLRGHGDLRTMGEHACIGAHHGAICIPGGPFSGRFSESCEQFFMRVDRATMTRHTGMDLVQFDPRIDLRRPELQPWFAQLRLLASEPEMARLAQRNPAVAAELERMLIALVLAGQAHQPAPAKAGDGIAPRAVRRAEAYIEAHAHEAICLDDIAQAAGVPVRTLLDGFKRFRDCTPMQSVREHRLQRVREVLVHATPRTRVAQAALDCGFVHLGRFAQLYQQRYGETPSQTLAERRRAA